jgi:hypothetical protein
VRACRAWGIAAARVVAGAFATAPPKPAQPHPYPQPHPQSNPPPGDLLGQGGFAEVHRATLVDPSLPGFEEPVAVKTLRPDVLRSPQELREFLAEANLLRKMAHP